MSGDTEFDQYRLLCWENAIHTFGTSYIFQQRARSMKQKLLWINYVGVATPLLVGATALTFGAADYLKVVIVIAGALLLLQVVFNLWSMLGGWVEQSSYASVSAAANDSLSTRYQGLAASPPENLLTLKHEYEKLQVEDSARRNQDMSHSIRESEKRMGMRAALRKMQRQCAQCEKVPTSMNPADCDVCGSFKYSDS